MNFRTSILSVVTLIGIFATFFLLYSGVSYGQSSFNEAANDAISMDLALLMKEKQQFVEKTGEGVVMVVAYDATGTEAGRGSGFFVDREGRIITNASFLKEAYSAQVLSETTSYDDVVILNRDEEMDIALIQVKATEEVSLALDYEYQIKPGERVIIVGKSSGQKKTFSEGLISSIERKGELTEIIGIHSMSPFLSYRPSKDGPLLNMSGNVIGVTSFGIATSKSNDGIPRMPDYQNITAIRINSVRPFLLQPDNAEQLKPAKSRVWSLWLMGWLKAAGITAFITLYSIGFPKLLAFLFLIIIVISIIQWIYFKLKRRIPSHE